MTGQQNEIDLLADALANLPGRVHGIVSRQRAANADRYALCQEKRYWNYRELANLQDRIAIILAVHGVRPGDRVMIIGENSLALVALLFALSSIDAWAVMVNAPVLEFTEIVDAPFDRHFYGPYFFSSIANTARNVCASPPSGRPGLAFGVQANRSMCIHF